MTVFNAAQKYAEKTTSTPVTDSKISSNTLHVITEN